MKSIFVIILSIFTGYALSLSGQNVEYELSMPEPHTHYFEVNMKVERFRGKHLDLKMPVWTPGSYLVREFAKSVEDFDAKGENGPLMWEKVNKNTWRIFTGKASSVEVNYKVYAYEMSVRTSFLDASHGYLNGTGIFMYLDNKPDIPARLKIAPYKDWKVVSTSLEPVEGEKWTYTVPNYDILGDSPIEIGNHKVYTFEAAGVKHEIAMYGEGNYNMDTLLRDMPKAVEACTKVFGVNPNKHYTFIVHNLDQGGGGLEHLSSTTLQTNRWRYQPGESYIGFLSLVMHEYFHLWNVKRVRPLALGPFNYNEENYTKLLWVSEGFTSYYDEMLLISAGFIPDHQYLQMLSGNISRFENAPGSKVQSAAEASFDAWIKYYRRNENSVNTEISYYTKGALIGTMLDLEIIQATKGEKTLDDVMRFLYNEYYIGENRGFTSEEVQKAVESVIGKDMSTFFDKYIYGVETIDYQKYLAYAGLDLVDLNKDNNSSVYFGASMRASGGKLLINSVIRGTSAYEGGINAEDEIIAVDGFRVDDNLFNKLLSGKDPGEPVNITLSRDGKIMNLSIRLMADNRLNYQIRKKENVREEEENIYKKWLRL